MLLPLDRPDAGENPLNQETYVVLKDENQAFGIASIFRGKRDLEVKLTRGL